MAADTPSDAILLETARLVLRRLTAADAENFYLLDNDPVVMRWINGGTPIPREVIVEQMLPGLMRYDSSHPWSGVWAAEDRCNGAWLGWISLRLTNPDLGEAVLGYRLCRAAWGRGLATEGASDLIVCGFADPAVKRITATTYEHNLASQHVLHKLGFSLVRRFRLTLDELHASDTTYSVSDDLWDGDDLLYALEREDSEAVSSASVRQACI